MRSLCYIVLGGVTIGAWGGSSTPGHPETPETYGFGEGVSQSPAEKAPGGIVAGTLSKGLPLESKRPKSTCGVRPCNFSLKCFKTSSRSCVRCCSCSNKPATRTRSARSLSRVSRSCASITWDSSSIFCKLSSSLACFAHWVTAPCSRSIRPHSCCNWWFTSSKRPCKSFLAAFNPGNHPNISTSNFFPPFLPVQKKTKKKCVKSCWKSA